MKKELIDMLSDSLRIYDAAVDKYKPDYVCVMFSGGDDSLTVLNVAKYLGIKVDFIIHGNTGTGLRKTTEFVRGAVKDFDSQYIEASAGNNYEDYVRRKGFFGRGGRAHTFSYHVLKSMPFRAAISKHIRKRKRGVKILLLNGVRVDESENRMDNFSGQEMRVDPSSNGNVWVNLIHNWSRSNCLDFLSDLGVERNPVSIALGRSGECMCGTMQNIADRIAASRIDPEWGDWIDNLERDVVKNFPWGWGSNSMTKEQLYVHQSTKTLFDDMDGFMPMCVGCKSKFNNRLK